MQPTEQKPLTAEQVQGSKRPVCVICASEVKVGQNYRDYPSIEHVPLNYCVDALRARVAEYDHLFTLQRRRMAEAREAWRAAHPGNELVAPDLGDLLTWLLARVAELERQRDEWEASSKATMELYLTTANNYLHLQAELTTERTRREQAEAEAERLLTPLPLDEWHEDTGDVLWWRMPIAEPPYVGSPLCSDWPYDSEHKPHLFWTPLPDCNRIHEAWGAALAGPNPQQSVKNAP